MLDPIYHLISETPNMPATKTSAFTTEFGSKRITAWAVMQERMKHGGKPLGVTYWSTHKPGQRKPVKHVLKNSTAFFSYINAADESAGDSSGESLTHQLFKEAIASLAHTKLKLENFGEHDVTITLGETEKKVLTEDGPYYADAYWRFNSTSDLDVMWSGEVYIEVNHTHAVPPYKEDSLRHAQLPVIEIDVPKMFEYPYEDEQSTDLREAEHVKRIQKILEEGFLAGRVISNRQSVQYLKTKVAHLQEQLKKSKVQIAHLENIAKESAQEEKTALTKANNYAKSLNAEKEKSRTLEQSLSKANRIVAEQRNDIRFYERLYLAVIVAMVCVAALMLYRNF